MVEYGQLQDEVWERATLNRQLKPATVAIVLVITVGILGFVLWKYAVGKTFTKEEASGGMHFRIPGAPNATEDKNK